MCEFSMKVILITGASSGIGAGAAKAFAKHGACLSITGRNKENLSKVAEECRKLGAKEVLEIIAHLDKQDDIEKTINETINKFKKLDVLVNNAGKALLTSIENVTRKMFDELIDINLKAPVFLTQLALPWLQKTKGNVVNVSSISSLTYTTPHLLVYCMGKSALDQFTKTVALGSAGNGVRINSINPGHVYTNAIRNICGGSEEAEKFSQAEAKCNPLGERSVTVEETANAILFLASDQAKMITGTCLCVDGGRVLTGQ